jgi:hypothetical protein
MSLTQIRIGLVLATLGAEFFLVLVLAFGGIEVGSGRDEIRWIGLPIWPQILIFPIAALSSVVATPESRRLAIALGRILLLLGCVGAVAWLIAHIDELDRGALAVGLVLPPAIVLLGVWLIDLRRREAESGK